MKNNNQRMSFYYIVFILTMIIQVALYIFLFIKVLALSSDMALGWKNIYFRNTYKVMLYIGFVAIIALLGLSIFIGYKIYNSKYSNTLQNSLIAFVWIFILLLGFTMKSIAVQNLSAFLPDSTSSLSICSQFAEQTSNQYINFLINFDLLTEKFNSLLCSKACPCEIRTNSSFDTTGLVGGGSAKNILDCAKSDLANIMNTVLASNKLNFLSDNIDIYRITEYLAEIELKYSCAGICPIDGKKYSKYIFSDINNGNPTYSDGCFQFINTYNPDFIYNYTRISVLYNSALFVNIIFLILMIYHDMNTKYQNKKNKEKNVNRIETQFSADIFNYKNPEEKENKIEENSSSESDEIEFDSDDEESENKSKDADLSDILE